MSSKVLTADPAAFCHKKPQGAPPPAPQTRISAKFLNIAVRQLYRSLNAGSQCRVLLGSNSLAGMFRKKYRGRKGRKEKERGIMILTEGARGEINGMKPMERRECQGLREGDNERKEEQKKKMRIRGRNGTGRQRTRGWREPSAV